MANVYCDQERVTGDSETGASWTNSYKTLALALNASNVGAGDTLWVKGNFATAGALSLRGVNAYTNNPPRVIGCKSATSATPPAIGDLIPGLRTGQAVFAYDDADAPTLTQTSAGADISMDGWMNIYGLVLKARDDFIFSPNNTAVVLEECEIRCGHGETGSFVMTGSGSNPRYFRMKNCKLSAGTSGRFTNSGKHGRWDFVKCIIDVPNSPMINNAGGNITFDSCDFSSQSGTLLADAGGKNANFDMRFSNCKINASSALVTGALAMNFRTEFVHTSSVTGKGTGGSFREVDIITSEGDVVLETSRVRTGGADDGGDGGWSLAFCPGVNGTRTNLVGLVGPWLAQEIVGDGTSQTLTVHIANDLAEDAGNKYDDEDVWIEVMSPSEAGTADWDYYTTQKDLEASVTEITTETVTWGSGANNDQALSITTIAPDYNGRLRWRLVFAKNFGATPDTLYLDPKAVLS